MSIGSLRVGMLIVAGAALAGCGVDVPHSVGLADRCGDIMRAAMPSAEIDITDRTSESTSITRMVARAGGVRTDLPKGSPGPRELAAECEFKDSILTAFHWTKGGPK
ncbi:MAG TPA: hypothetical protein VHW90_10815 [Stellaceae bacterium]|nr:hypothetical protein [Stellaceae bacterium]